jgi:hypothetical protein
MLRGHKAWRLEWSAVVRKIPGNSSMWKGGGVGSKGGKATEQCMQTRLTKALSAVGKLSKMSTNRKKLSSG